MSDRTTAGRLHLAALVTGVAAVAIIPAAGARRWALVFNCGLACAVVSAGFAAAARVHEELAELKAMAHNAEGSTEELAKVAMDIGRSVANLDDYRG